MLIKRIVVTEPVAMQEILNIILLGTNTLPVEKNILSVDKVEILIEKDLETNNYLIFVFVPSTRQVLRVDTESFSLEVLSI